MIRNEYLKTINIFVLKGDLNGENRSGAFLFLSGILSYLIVWGITLILMVRLSFLCNSIAYL